MIGNRVLLGVQSVITFGKQNMTMHADPFRIASCKQCGPRRGTYRARCVETGVLSTFGCQAIDIWRLDIWRTKAAEVVVTLIIREDDNEIWLLGRRAIRCESSHDTGDCKKIQRWFLRSAESEVSKIHGTV